MSTILIRREANGVMQISPEVFPIDDGNEKQAIRQLIDYGYSPEAVQFWLLDEVTMTCRKLEIPQ